MLIPRLIHQIWKTDDIPAQFIDFRDSWLHHHPGWTYRLWPDPDLRAFVERHEPQLIGMFDGYERPISRADIGRYVLLKHLGGLFVDLDFECFRALDPILATSRLAIGLEPDSHLTLEWIAPRNLPFIVCPSLIASVPHHPFWDRVLAEAVDRAHHFDVLEQTGPFLLTDCYRAYSRQETIDLLPAAAIYPADKLELQDSRLFNISYWEYRTRQAYALHHWDGAWYRSKSGQFPAPPRAVKVLTGGVKTQRPSRRPKVHAVITCVMLATAEFARIEPAVRAFQRQSYPDRELIIVDLYGDDAIRSRLDGDLTILVLRPERGLSPAAAFDNAVAEAAGDYICHWHPDDLYDPQRLALQFGALQSRQAEACLLERCVAWRPAVGQLTVCEQGPGIRSLLCERAVHMGRAGSDAEPGRSSDEEFLNSLDLVRVFEPRLYVRVVEEPAPEVWPPAGVSFVGARARAIERELGRTLPFSCCARYYGRSDTPSFWLDRSDRLDAGTPGSPSSLQADATPSRAPAPRPADQTQRPRVLVLTPVRNAARHLPAFGRALYGLDYPKDRLSIAFLEGDSEDHSKAILTRWLPRLKSDLRNAELFFHDAGHHFEGPRWASAIQFKRRNTLARIRNRLLQAALRDEDWVLWIDADVIDYPPDTLTRLLDARRDIVVPNCVRTPGGPSFDLNTFQTTHESLNAEQSEMIDGIVLPPRGHNRLYLADLRGQDLVKVDCVGGAMLLVNAELHREGLVFPTFPYRGYIETEGLAVMAGDIGVTSWGMPDLEVIHAPD